MKSQSYRDAGVDIDAGNALNIVFDIGSDHEVPVGPLSIWQCRSPQPLPGRSDAWLGSMDPEPPAPRNFQGQVPRRGGDLEV